MDFPFQLSATAVVLILSALITPSIYYLFWIPRKENRKRAPPEAAGAWPLIGHLHLLGGSQPPYMTLENLADKYGPIFTVKLGVHRILILSATAVVLILSALITPLIYYLFWISKKENRKRAPPEAAGAWPLIGHLHLLGGSRPPHITLGNLADKYGPIFTVKLGVHRALIVSNSEMAKECLTTNDKAFATRPMALAMDILGYNYSMLGFSHYGAYWRLIRKITTLEIIVNRRYVDYVSHREEKSSDEWRDSLRTFFELSGMFVVSDALPFLRWMDLGGVEKAMKRTAKNIDHVAEKWLEEHKQKKASGTTKREEDFMDLMLSVLDDIEGFSNRNTDTINKATCLVCYFSTNLWYIIKAYKLSQHPFLTSN
ncbi:hypothetical protein OIU78_016061 [Salix suchowensis]|nr:hypothetical protein OIU78_016061 [Salix suchowensis]